MAAQRRRVCGCRRRSRTLCRRSRHRWPSHCACSRRSTLLLGSSLPRGVISVCCRRRAGSSQRAAGAACMEQQAWHQRVEPFPTEAQRPNLQIMI